MIAVYDCPSLPVSCSLSVPLFLSLTHCLSLFPSLSRDQPLLLQVLLTDDHSTARKDCQAASSCLIKLPRPKLTSACPPVSTAAGPAPGGSPRNVRRTGGPCSDFRRPLTSTKPLPALSTDTQNHTHLTNLAPPLHLKEVSQPAQVVSPPGLCEQLYGKHPQTTPPKMNSTFKKTPPISTCPFRNWSHLQKDQHDTRDSAVHPPIRSKMNLPSFSLTHCGWSRRPSSVQDFRATQPMVKSISQHYGSQVATEGRCSAEEELSDLDCLCQAGLKDPNIHQGSCHQTPPSFKHKPG